MFADRACILALGAVIVAFPGASLAAAPSPLELEEIIAGMRGFERRFLDYPDWYVRYVQEREYAEKLPPGFSSIMKRIEFTNVRKGESVYAHRHLQEEDLPEGMARESSCVWKDGVCVHQVSGVSQIMPDLHAQAWESFYYTSGVFLNVHSKTPFELPFMEEVLGASSPYEVCDNLFALPATVERYREEFTVRPETEEVDGAACVVLERTGRDVLWIDVEHGFVCRRRVWYEPSGNLLSEFKNEDFVERQPGLWLPSRLVQVRYNYDQAPPEFRGKYNSTHTVTLEEIYFGNVPDSLFDVPRPEGGKVFDHLRGLSYQVYPEGTTAEEALERAISRAMSSDELPELRSSGTTERVVLYNLLVLGGVVLLCQIQRARRKPRTSPSHD